MTTDVVTVNRDTPFKDIAALLDRHAISAVLVVDEQRHVLGVVSEADLLARHDEPPNWLRWTPARRAAHRKATGRRAHTLMSTPTLTVGPDADLGTAARLLRRAGVRRLPVVDDQDVLVGLVSRRDLLGVFLRPDQDIADEIRLEVFTRALCADPKAVTVDVRDGIAVLRGQLDVRSAVAVAVRLTRAVDGVVDVIDRLTWATDDTDLPPAEPTNVGVLHELRDRWPHRQP